MSSLKAYLAANYMSGPKADAILARAGAGLGGGDAPIKKKRKKVKNEDYPSGRGESSSGSGLMLRDEDEAWRSRRDDDDEIEGEDAPVFGKDLATFQKSKSQWSSVGSTSLPLRPKSEINDDPSNATAGPSTINPNPDEVTVKKDPDGPDSPPPPPQPPAQITKRKGGLRTAAQMRAEEERLAAEMAGRSPSPPLRNGVDEDGEEIPDPTVTVHRDAAGRIVDVVALKEEERRKEVEEKRKEREREEWSKGITQRRQREERALLEEEMGRQDVARRADDVGMNRELREVERWNDPAAGFLTRRSERSKGPKRPKYKGAAPLNRFGILPGYRWDGVDRSNGFEKKAFQYQNAAVRKEYEANQWSVEDM